MTYKDSIVIKKLSLLIACSCLLTSCARSPSANQDPYEGYNRFMFGFNRAADKVLIKPITEVYNFITPPPLQRGISNAFDNLGEITTLPNDILQGKFKFALKDIARLVINTTIGIGGLFDVATHMGIHHHYEDFGMTLAYWEGNKVKSPYLVLPIFGPTTFRAGFGSLADLATNPLYYLKNEDIGYYALGLRYVNVRSNLLPAEKLIDSAFDPYAFVRDAYLQKRNRMLANNEHLEKHMDSADKSNRYMSPDDYQSSSANPDKQAAESFIDDDVANAPVLY